MSKEQRIDQLELSVRTNELFSLLGVVTVADLLARPELVLEGPPATTRMVRLEIEAALATLGLVYPGRFVTPAIGTVASRVTGDVTERWRAIELWLTNNHPNALAGWNPPATLPAIAEAEAKLGIELPAEYKAFLALHNGQSESAPMLVGALLPVEQLATTASGIYGDVDDDDIAADRAGKGVRAVDWSVGWIPIAKSASGRDYLCIDLDPAADGTRGQIIQYRVDTPARPLIALGFADLLSLYLEQIQSGDIDLARD